MDLYEKRLLDDLKIMLKRLNDLEDRYFQLTHDEVEEYYYILDKYFLFKKHLKEYRSLFKSS